MRMYAAIGSPSAAGFSSNRYPRITPASSKRWTRSVTAGDDIPTRRPSSDMVKREILFRLTLLCYTEGMTAEETIASLEAQLKQALERLDEVTEQLRVAQARIEELAKLKT